MNLNYLFQNRTKLAQKIHDLQSEIKKSPPGELICTQNSKYTKWYVSFGSTSKYIKKKDRKYAETLAHKKLMKYQWIEYKQELSMLNEYISKLETVHQKSQNLLNNPLYMELLEPFWKSEKENYQEWMLAKYERNKKYPEKLVHGTKSGNMVRSKSEAIIADTLFAYNIPFRYECELHLGELTLYPDFTILDPNTGEIIYWEHFGLMDVESYASNCFSKLNIYAQNGMFPNINLITTYETEKIPLTSVVVENIMKGFWGEDVCEHYAINWG